MGSLPIIFYIIIGISILLLCKFPPKTLHVFGLVALAFWLGVLGVTFVIIVLAVVTGKFFFEIFWVIFLLSVLIIIRGKRDLRQYVDLPSIPQPGKRLMHFVPLLPLLIFSIISIYYVVSAGTAYPIVSFDAIGNFALKAKLWFYSRELFPSQLLDPEYLMYKRRYPPVVPVSECVWATFFGEWDGTRPKYFFLFCWVCVGLLIFSLLKKRTSGITAWTGTAMWYLVPISLYVWGGAVAGYADVPFAMSLLAAVFMVGEFHSSKNRYHILLMSVAIAGTFWIKKEGTLFVMAVLVFLLWRRVAWRTIATVVAVAAGFFLVYALTTVNVPHFFEKDITLNLSRQELLRRGQEYFVLLQYKLTNGKNWGDKLWYVFAAAWTFKFLCVSRKRWVNREFYFFVFLYLINTVVLLFTCYDFSRNMDWAFDRLLTQIYPLLIVATFDGVGVQVSEEIVQLEG